MGLSTDGSVSPGPSRLSVLVAVANLLRQQPQRLDQFRFIKRSRSTGRRLRTSHATWLVQAGADPKSVQGQMRHSRISTTMEIYAQIVPLAQRRALEQLSEFAEDSRSKTVQ